MDCDFAEESLKSTNRSTPPSGADPREYHICINCLKSWLNEINQ